MARDFRDIEKRLKDNSEAVELALEEYFSRRSASGALGHIIDAQKYSLLGGGKRIRPFLTNEVCRILGGESEASMPLAIAVEMIHTYSLIHDDLPCMDDDDIRRGKPSNHKAFGEGTAVLAGDALLTNAFEAACEAKIGHTALVSAIAHIARAAGDGGMIGGQITDILGEGKTLSCDELLVLHALKTGRMIRLSAALGALAAGYCEDSEEYRAVCGYADKIGLVFQIIDDILDVTGDEATVGKTLSSDSEKQKTTFLSFYSIDEARRYAERLTDEAVEQVNAVLGEDGVLSALAYYLLTREK